MANEYTPDLITLIGDDGKEIEFEILDIIENDGSTAVCHSGGDSKTDAVRSAGDQGNLAGQIKRFGSALCHNRVLQSNCSFAGKPRFCSAGRSESRTLNFSILLVYRVTFFLGSVKAFSSAFLLYF